MTTDPNQPDDALFESWKTAEDFQAYVDSTSDHSALLNWMLRTGKPGPAMGPKPASLPIATRMQVTSIRLPEQTLAELDAVAEADHVREGRSGVIRAAVDHYLANRRHAS